MKIVVEANIGAGKTTVLRKIHEATRLPIFLEPIDDWSLLDDFYKDTERWSFTFSCEVLMSFFKWKNNTYDALYERSPTSCRYIFTKMHHDSKAMNDKELKLFDKFYKQLSWKSDHTIYIKTDPTICYERMKHRSRECESAVPISYLEKLHEAHENLIKNMDNVYIVDGNQDVETVFHDVLDIIKNLRD